MVSQPGEDHREGGGSSDGDPRKKEIQISGETLCVSVSQIHANPTALEGH